MQPAGLWTEAAAAEEQGEGWTGCGVELEEVVEEEKEVELLLSLRPLAELEASCCSASPLFSPPHRAPRRTSAAPPWVQTPPWRRRSAPAWTARSPRGRRSAACRAWWGRGAWSPCSWRSTRPPASAFVRSPSRAPPATPPPTPRRGYHCAPPPGTGGRGQSAALPLLVPAGAPGRWGTLRRTSAGSGLSPPDSSSTLSWPGRHRAPAGQAADGWAPPGSSPAVCCPSRHCLSDRWTLLLWCVDHRSVCLRSLVGNLLLLMVQTCSDQGWSAVSQLQGGRC